MRFKNLGGLLMVVVLALGVTACGSSSKFDASKVPCGAEVSKQLSNAQSALADATTKANNVKTDTPDGKSASQAKTKAQAKVDALTARQTACQPKATPSPAALNADTIVNQLFGKGAPLEGMHNQVVVGSNKVDFKANTEERGTAAFSKKTLKTQKDVANFLNGSSAQSKAAKMRVTSAIKAAGYGNDEVARALNGTGYFPLQIKVAAQILGTTYFKDGKVLEGGEWRQVGPNDVFWMFLTKDNRIIFGATVRADCGNPNLKKVRPVTPTTPKVPPITKPFLTFPCEQSGNTQQPGCPPGVNRVQQPPQVNPGQPVGTTSGAPATPPPATRPPGDPNGGSGNGGATPDPSATPDNTNSGDQTGTSPSPSSPPCPFGPGNC